MASGGLIDALFKASFDMIITDFELLELVSPPGSDLIGRGLTKRELSPDELIEHLQLTRIYRRPSPEDLSLLVVAKRENMLLITDDKALRLASEAEGIEVHGTLWILDQLVALGVVESEHAYRALRAMEEAGGRFPSHEVAKRKQQWTTP